MVMSIISACFCLPFLIISAIGAGTANDNYVYRDGEYVREKSNGLMSKLFLVTYLYSK